MNDEAKGCPEEVELLAEALLRTCARNNVCFTGFIYGAGTDTRASFVSHISTIKDRGQQLKNIHVMLLDFIERTQPEQTVLRKNDA